MNNLGRILLLIAALLLAFVIGVLVGRGQGNGDDGSAEPTGGMQITTEEPVVVAPAEPLPAPAPAPPAAAIPKAAPDVQVQEDAAAVGMTTRDEPEIVAPDAEPARPAPESPAPGSEP
jgi:hypothetical protein